MKITKYTNLNLGESEKDFEGKEDYLNLPWPYKDQSVDLIKADHVLTKVPRDKFIDFMNECWRVMKYDGQFMISISYGMSYEFVADPKNVNPLNELTFTFFDPLEPIAGKYNYKIYKPKPWKITHLSFKIGGLMELLLIKRREDKSYVK